VRLFLDQMFRVELAAHLRAEGHDVVRASEIGLSRADDADLLAQAIAQERVLLTMDGHFGDWVVLPLASHCGVIRLRVQPTTTENALRVLRPLLTGRTETHFSKKEE
jgi:predicted nuclease of predicted toxin-antitoxin system